MFFKDGVVSKARHLQSHCPFWYWFQLVPLHQVWPIEGGMRNPESPRAHRFNLRDIVENSVKAPFNTLFRTWENRVDSKQWLFYTGKRQFVASLCTGERFQPGLLVPNKTAGFTRFIWSVITQGKFGVVMISQSLHCNVLERGFPVNNAICVSYLIQENIVNSGGNTLQINKTRI